MLIQNINVNIFYDENDAKMDEMDETDDETLNPRTPAIIVFSVIEIDGGAFIGCNALESIVRRPPWVWPDV